MLASRAAEATERQRAILHLSNSPDGAKPKYKHRPHPTAQVEFYATQDRKLFGDEEQKIKTVLPRGSTRKAIIWESQVRRRDRRSGTGPGDIGKVAWNVALLGARCLFVA
jgi:hypothetical protein